jgi:hypothetical protein
MKIIPTLCALTLSLFGAPTLADTLKAVPAKLDPAKAYVLVEYQLQPNPYPGSLRSTLPLDTGLIFARYDPALCDVRGLGKAKGNPVPARGAATEPFRGGREIAKAEGKRLFLLAVEPDTWVIQGWGTTSFSLGSYALALAPGTITDLGVVSGTADWAEGDRALTMSEMIGNAFIGPFGKKPAIAPMRASFRPRSSNDLPIPTGLPMGKVQPVAFIPNAKFGNYLGGLVNRIEGVNNRLKTRAASPAEMPDAGTSH